MWGKKVLHFIDGKKENLGLILLGILVFIFLVVNLEGGR